MPVVTGVGRRLAALRITLCGLAAVGAILLLASVPATVLEIEVAGTRKVAAGADLSHSGAVRLVTQLENGSEPTTKRLATWTVHCATGIGSSGMSR